MWKCHFLHALRFFKNYELRTIKKNDLQPIKYIRKIILLSDTTCFLKIKIYFNQKKKTRLNAVTLDRSIYVICDVFGIQTFIPIYKAKPI